VSPGVPNETALNFYLHEGAVFYIQDRGLTSQQPHYFVVLNHDPRSEETLLLAVSSSQIENTHKLHAAKPPETLVEIAESDYADFTKDSIISCNQVFTKTVTVHGFEISKNSGFKVFEILRNQTNRFLRF